MMEDNRTLQLTVPDGVQVHVTIGNRPVPWVPGEVAPRSPRRSDGYPRRSGAVPTTLKGLLTVVVLGGTFAAGIFAGSPPRSSSLAAALAAMPVPPPAGYAAPPRPFLPEQHGFPDRPLPREPAGLAAPAAAQAQVPEQFAQQLRQPPTIIPPPGQAAGGPAARNAFGLDN